MKTSLQKIIESVSDESLDSVWKSFDYEKFSENKSLYDFQQNALRNAAKALNFFCNEKKADKKLFFDFYKLNDFNENLDYDLKKKEDSKAAKYLLDYENDFPVNEENKISFEHFVNRMDPKGVQHTDAFRKINGFRNLFEDSNNKPIKIKFDNYDVIVKLLILPKDIAQILPEYLPYCFDNLSQLEKKININS